MHAWYEKEKSLSGFFMVASLNDFDQALEEIYAALPDVLSREIAEEVQVQSPLAHPDRQAIARSFASELMSLRQRCRNGLEHILEKLKSNPETSDKGLALEKYMYMTFQSVRNPTTFTKVLLRIITGEAWAEALKVTAQSIELLYNGAKAIFEEGRFEEATLCFIFLSWFDSRQFDFWMALGHCQFHTDNYPAAIRSYGVASYCLPTESWPFVYSASCFEAMGDVEQASIYLKEGLLLERKKATADHSLIISIEQKLDECQRGPVSPIS